MQRVRFVSSQDGHRVVSIPNPLLSEGEGGEP